MLGRKQQIVHSVALLASLGFVVGACEARNINGDEMSAVIPSPNQEFGDEDIMRKSAEPRVASGHQQPIASAASNEETVPVYVSPFARTESGPRPILNFVRQESSHAPLNYAPRPSQLEAAPSQPKDLKASASYGHHHGGYEHGAGGHHGYDHDHSGWLDMGAWTGGKGSFGWYADYPVGKGHHGYGRK